LERGDFLFQKYGRVRGRWAIIYKKRTGDFGVVIFHAGLTRRIYESPNLLEEINMKIPDVIFKKTRKG